MTNNGTWTMNGTISGKGTFVGDLTNNGTIDPGDSGSTWTCGDALEYGGESYTTVLIGTQCWMAENLNIGDQINGGNNLMDNGTIEKYCYNDNASSECDTYGGMYQWDEMMQYTSTIGTQGVCPTGWHLPSDADWTTLENSLPANDKGSRLADNDQLWLNGGLVQSAVFGTSGFAALPGGYYQGSFAALGSNVNFWSSTEGGAGKAWIRTMNWVITAVERFDDPKDSGYSVRCVMDD